VSGKGVKVKLVYCSGPLFCPEEIAGMTAIARVLENAGYGTFLPHRDGVERLVMGLVNSTVNIDVFGSRDRIDRAIFSLDVYQIVERCDCLVFNMNGRVPDEGACVEAGVAFAAGKPVVIYKNDRRTAFKGRDNSMINGLSAIPPVSDLKKLPKALNDVFAGHRSPDRANLPESLQKAVAYGEKMWKIMGNIPKGRQADEGDLVKQILEAGMMG
jgi:nucleoside 2-deoxyribosyltransferase